jgi:hypothetical protein
VHCQDAADFGDLCRCAINVEAVAGVQGYACHLLLLLLQLLLLQLLSC